MMTNMTTCGDGAAELPIASAAIPAVYMRVLTRKLEQFCIESLAQFIECDCLHILLPSRHFFAHEEKKKHGYAGGLLCVLKYHAK